MAVTVMATLVTTGWAGVVCPNEGVRSELRSAQLPDCRAYERVTPAYKESGIVTQMFAASPEGARVIVGSLGVFGGAEQDTLGAEGHTNGVTYMLSRTPEGWTAESLTPPASAHNNFGLLDASRDLDASLWELTETPVGEVKAFSTSLYIERAERPGVFEKTGPMTPAAGPAEGPEEAAYVYLGASENLSHILFTVRPRLRWPFDETIGSGSALYEYVGVERPGETARKPTLVGVGEGQGGELISDCGTRLGSSAPAGFVSGVEQRSGSVYNAISASGSRIFFTAVGAEEASETCRGPLFGELYAREETPLLAGELPAATARAVAISEPSPEDCTACRTEPAARRAAIFQGASRDGSKVFFTTEQELLPGARGVNLYEYDFEAPAGERVKLLSADATEPAAVQGVARISEDGSHVYFVAQGDLTGAATAGQDNLYVYSDGRVSFIATLAPNDSGDWAAADNRPVLASEEGRFLVFTSVADLTNEGVAPGKAQVFQYDAQTGALVRVSIGQGGYRNDGREPEEAPSIVGQSSAYEYTFVDSPASAGRWQAPADGAVFFSSPDALTPQALSDRHVRIRTTAGSEEPVAIPNVYEYRAGNVYLLSDGRDVSIVNSFPGTYLATSDPSGEDAFLLSSDPLIPADGDTQQDLYDARVDGGFPTPSPAAACAGESCQGALTGAPALAPLGGSAVQTGEAEAPALASPAVKPKLKQAARKPKPRARKGRKARPRKKAKAGLHRGVGRRAAR